MDYKIVGKYNQNKESLYNENLLIEHDNAKYEISKFPIYSNYSIVKDKFVLESIKIPLKKKYKKIEVRQNHIFICYDKRLEIYNMDGSSFKVIQSTESIVIGSGGFLVFDKVYYIFNYFCDTIFIENPTGVIDFSAEGEMLYLDNGNLAIKFGDEIKVYNQETKPMLNLENIDIFNHSSLISNVISCKIINIKSISEEKNKNDENKKIDKEPSNCFIVLCKENIFLIYNDLIIRKSISSGFTDLIPERFYCT